MLFGMYAPVPHVTVGSKEITRSVTGALKPLPDGEIDPAFTLAKDVLCAADKAGFDLCLYAERHLGADFEAWMLAAAISSWTKQHPRHAGGASRPLASDADRQDGGLASTGSPPAAWRSTS